MDELEKLFNSSTVDELLSTEAEENGLATLNKTKITDTDKTLQSDIKETTADAAVAKSLVPLRYKDAKFDSDRIKASIMEDMKRKHNMYSVEKFYKYEETCYGILSQLRTGSLPDRSWLIGAPNGFGKTTFVNECILTMEEKGMRTVPYISLLGLAEIRKAEEKRLTGNSYRRMVDRDMSEDSAYIEINGTYHKMPIDITGRYSWSEYMDAECLFCFLTDISSKEVESHILYQTLAIRAAKGLPTIVMISTSIEPYLNRRELKEQVWDEILGIENLRYGYDLLTHVSCYKIRRNSIMNAEESLG